MSNRDKKNAARLPTFVGIGGHKCASTWLSECMREHPQIFVSEPKETAFFSNRYQEGLTWYTKHFEGSADYCQAGEYTSHYLYDPNVPQRILETLGRVRIIAVIREPVSRAVSQIKYGIRHGFLDRPSVKVISLPQLRQFIDEYSPIIDRSMYLAGIQRFIGKMGAQNVLVLDQQDCSKNPELVLRKVWSYLGVDKSVVATASSRRVSVGITPKVMFLERIRKRIFYFVNSRDPGLITLTRKLRIGDLYRRANAGKDIELSMEAHEYLSCRFLEDWHKASQYCWHPEHSRLRVGEED